MVVVIDNLNLHTTDEVRKAIEDTGAKLVFLPTYAPSLLEPLNSFILLLLLPSILSLLLIFLAGFTNVMLVPCSSENRYSSSISSFVKVIWIILQNGLLSLPFCHLLK